MKRVLSVLALAAASTLAAPSFAETSAGGSTWRAVAAGAFESPPNASPGFAVTSIEVNGQKMFVDLPFQSLAANTEAAHIHCCTSSAFSGTAPVAVPLENFPTGVTSGTYTTALALGSESTYSPSFLAANGGTAQGASSALLEGIAANQAYVNIHTSKYPNGEIRGFIVAAPVPEPGEWAMLGAGLAGLLWMGRRRRQL